jgi:hypothetical protein
MADPNPFTSRLLQQAMQPQTRVPFAPPAQTAAPTQSAMSPQQQRLRAAFLNALARPDMPIEPQFSTGSAAGDEQAMLRARYARMLDAGRSAVAERAAAQGRSLQTGADGMPVYGDAPATPIVQESPGGVRVAYRNGMPVGFSTPRTLNPEERLFNKQFQTDVAARRRQIETETNALPAAQRASIAARLGVENTSAAIAEALSAGVQNAGSVAATPERGEAIRRQATELAADQSVARMRAAQILRAAGATAPAVAAAEGSPAAAPAVQATAAPIRAGLSPVTGAVSADGSTYSATGLPVLRPGSQPVVEDQVDGETTPEEELAQAERFMREQPARDEEAQRKAQQEAYQQQIDDTRRRLAQARMTGNKSDVFRFSNQLRSLMNQPAEERAAQSRVAAMGQAMFRGVTPPPANSGTAAPSAAQPGNQLNDLEVRPEVVNNPSLSYEDYAIESNRLRDLFLKYARDEKLTPEIEKKYRESMEKLGAAFGRVGGS